MAQRLPSALAALLAGCAALPPSPPAPEPAWVAAGSGAVEQGTLREFRGVGVYQARNARLRTAAAEGRARAEVRKQVDVFAVALFKTYCCGYLPEEPPPPEEWTVRTQRLIAAQAEAAEVAATWEPPGGGTTAVLVRLDLARIVDALKADRSLNAKQREGLLRDVPRLFEELAAETSKEAAVSPSPPP